MPLLIERRSFQSGVRRATPSVRKELVRALTRLAEADPPAPMPGDARISLWVPTLLELYEHVLPNTGWSLLYDVTASSCVLVFLCEAPPR